MLYGCDRSVTALPDELCVESSRENSSDRSCKFRRLAYGWAFEKYTLGCKTFLKTRARAITDLANRLLHGPPSSKG